MKKKETIYLVLFIALLFIFSISLVIFFKSDNGIVNEDDVYIESTTLTVSMKDILSVNDDFGKTISDTNGGAFGYVDIDIVNDANKKRNYQLYLTESSDTTNTISPSFVKVYLTDFKDDPISNYNSNIVPSYTTFAYLKDKPSSKLILNGTIEANKRTSIRLRSWISDSFVIENGKNTFSFDIGIRAVK